MSKKAARQGAPKAGKRQNGGVKTREIAGILGIAFFVFALLSLYVNAAGIIGLSVRRALRVCFGDLAALFILVFLLIAFQIFRGKKRPFSAQRMFGLVLIVVAITLFTHMLYYRGHQFPPGLSEELSFGRRGEGAGIAGALLLVLSYTALGIQGSYVLILTSTLLGLIFLFEFSLLDLIRRLWTKYQERRQRRQLKRQAKAQAKAKARSGPKPKRVRKPKPASKPAPEPQPEQGSEAQEPPPEPPPRSEPPPERRSAPESGPRPAAKSGEATEPLILNLPQGKDGGGHELPPTSLLKRSPGRGQKTGGVQQRLLEETFASFGIEAKVVNIAQGPVVTRYELQPAPGIKVSRITALADDLALALAAADVRIEAPVPGKSVVGIEVPNRSTEAVLLRDVLESPAFAEHPSPVALALGKDIAGNPVIADLKKWLHILVAGATGSGKSVCLNAMIASLLFRTDPEKVKLLMIDPKRVELSVYDGIPHLISPVVTDPRKAAVALRWAVSEMERRYQLFADTQVRNIDMYLELASQSDLEEPLEELPYIVLVVDELADLMMVAAAEVEDSICRLAQMARAAGMYLIIATQRPSVDVITGLIKANVPSRISFAVSSQVDSRTILDMGGAERLIGKGDMLYYPIGASKPIRAQGAWISDREVENLVKFWKKQGEPEYQEAIAEASIQVMTDEGEDDELLPDAIRLVVENGQASISMLQRRFRIGYSRAARLIDVLEVRGIVGTYQGSKPREVLVDHTILEGSD